MIISPIQYFHELSKPILRRLKNSIVSIFSFDSNDFPFLKGSGVLISLSNRKFLITANHLLDDAKSFPLFYFSKNQFSPFNGNFWRIPKAKSFAQDFLDVAVLELTNEQTNELSDYHTFYDVTSETISFGTEHKLFFLMGFPFRRNKPNQVTHKLRMRIFPYLGSKIMDQNILKRINRNEPENIIIDYKRKRIKSEENEIGQGPKVVGCSGGGIFEVDSSKMLKAKTIEIKLSGIFIEYLEKEHVLVGTNICFPLEIIRHKIPELSDELPRFPKINVNFN